MSSTKLPSQLGYRMPAEWEPHEATWLSWPHNAESWPGLIEKIPPIWADMVFHLHTHEKVHINVIDQNMENAATLLLKEKKVDLSQIIFHHFATNDAWARDHGPVFVTRTINHKKEIAVTNWEFNKWGGKYPPWDLDNQIPDKVAQYLNLPSFKAGIVMEGGSIDVNGEGILLTSESCLLNKNRNPHLSQKQIEQYLMDYLGVQKILWLGDGIVGDDTDGHIDDIARFTDANTIVTVVERDLRQENYSILKDNLKKLYHMRNLKGEPFRIVTLPMPSPITIDGQRVPASYANFYIGNGVVLLPAYKDPNDLEAYNTMQRLFPTRKIVAIDSSDLIWGLGAFHCVTQQQPSVI